MTQETVDVTIVVPCYNTAKFLDQCLTSIEANDRASIEVIVLNDGSTDNSLEIMRAHEAADPRVRVIDKPNQGYGASVNRGFDEARGTYVAIVEPDDYVDPHMYDELFELALANGTPDIVKSSYWRVWMPCTPKEHMYHCGYYNRIKPGHQPFKLADAPNLVQYHPSIWSALYRREFLDEKNIRFKEVPGAGWVDNPFLFETLCQADTIVYTDKPYYRYREDLPGSSSVLRYGLLPFERWNDMADVVDRLGIQDEGILHCLYMIGFSYVGGAIRDGGLDDPVIAKAIAQVFSRMRYDILAGCVTVPKKMIKLACEMSGRPMPNMPRSKYVEGLVKEFDHNSRVNGLPFGLSRVGIYVRRQFAQNEHIDDPTRTRSASI
jgi:glycosyltransferase involved in cell wall biosynthesis